MQRLMRVLATVTCASALATGPAKHARPRTSLQASNEEPLLLRAARGEKVERTPVWMMRQAGRHMKVYRDLVKKYPTFRERSEIPEAALEISLQPWRAYGVDGVIMFSDILTPLPAMGVEFGISEGGAIAIDPIRTEAQLAKMKGKGEFDATSACPFVGEILGKLRAEVGNKATVIGFVGLPFTLASYLVEGKTGTTSGFAEVKKMRQENPALLHGILTKLADNIGEYACYQVDQGAQVIQVFDSWAGHLPKDQYEIFAMPYQKAVIAAIKAKHPTTPVIIYMAPDVHSKDGAFLDLLATTGVDCVSLDYTVDFASVRSSMPAGMALQGNLDPKILRDGPLEAIEAHTLKILEAGACDGHIMNLGHGIEADTPEPHAKFFVDTVQAFRAK